MLDEGVSSAGTLGLVDTCCLLFLTGLSLEGLGGSDGGEGPLGLIGLTSSGPGGVGEPGGAVDPRWSIRFHLVDETDVFIEGGRGPRFSREAEDTEVAVNGGLRG